jgi:hypothetical protein
MFIGGIFIGIGGMFIGGPMFIGGMGDWLGFD